eukprot:TRINITY_DN7791_c0_g1_i3.p1 TRINITY_DN7791_c0_g1~~TRINITY_DN7791_c0_g1_i3.p1  ORF type:complete len:354 (+),score=102.09 TRINITY_DN7791_c0_g1_i3:119-1180(+)
MEYTLQASGVEEKAYSLVRLWAPPEIQDLNRWNPPVEIGRVGVNKKIDSLENVPRDQRQRFHHSLQQERKQLPWRLRDAGSEKLYEAKAEESDSVYYVFKRGISGNVFTVHRCSDWYEFRKVNKSALTLEEATAKLKQKKSMPRGAEAFIGKEEEVTPKKKKIKEDSDDDFRDDFFGENLNDVDKEETLSTFKTESKATPRNSFTPDGKKLKKLLDEDDLSSESEGELGEIEQNFLTKSKKGSSGEKTKEKSRKRKKGEMPQVPAKKVKIEPEKLADPAVPDIEAKFEEELRSLLLIRGEMTTKQLLDHFKKSIKGSSGGKDAFKKVLMKIGKKKKRLDGETTFQLLDEFVRH